MKIILILGFLLALGATNPVHAENENESKPDTIQSHFLNEIVVTSSFKETNPLNKLPGSVSIISPLQVDGLQIEDVTSISTLVPNFYIPDYGSKYTSPVYVRGIGNRSTGQASGMYVDNVPLMNKSTYDFDFIDIQRVELLRGPQGTLYGRNAMGGILSVFTPSPLTLQQTKIGITGGNYGLFKAKASTHTKINDQLGFSAGAYYDRNDGYFTNEYNGKKADALESAGGHLRLDYRISNKLKASLIADYDFSDQGAYPYHVYNKKTGEIKPINYNDEGSYLRRMGYTALNLEYKDERIILASTTSYQGLNDDMKMDQDYTALSVYNINQRQTQKAFTEEITVKSNTKKNYQWSFGAFGFYTGLKTDVKVNFEEVGVQSMIQSQLNLAHKMGGPKMTVLDSTIPAPAAFNSPSYGGAIFHQSTYNNLFVEGLSVTAGFRLDYEKDQLDYDASANMTVNVDMEKPYIPPFNARLDTTLKGSQSTDYIEFMPKLALKYELDHKRYVYASVSSGYNPGGFNIQTFSELALMSSLSKLNPQAKPVDIKDVTTYGSEYSWNYEVGFKGSLIDNILSTEISLFYIDINDMQLTEFGLAGRKIDNVGKAVNKGFDITLNAKILPELTVGVNYGFTHATFKNYYNGRVDSLGNKVNFSGKYLPYVPQQTFSLYGAYVKSFSGRFIDQFSIQAQYNGAGKIYWTETNDIAQKFYGLLNAKVGITKGIFALNLWTKNALNQDYNSFYFEMNGVSYLQQGKPATFGVDLNVTF